MIKKKILLIDDEREFADMITMRLRASGYEVMVSVDGESGLERARKERPDLVILDIVLPKLDGHKVCQSIKSEAQLSGIPVILLSGKDQATLDGMKRSAIADAYFLKPVEDRELLEKIKVLLRKKGEPDAQ